MPESDHGITSATSLDQFVRTWQTLRTEGPRFWHRLLMISSQSLTRCSLLNCFKSWPDFSLAASALFCSSWRGAEIALLQPEHQRTLGHKNSSLQRFHHRNGAVLPHCLHMPSLMPSDVWALLRSSAVAVKMGRLGGWAGTSPWERNPWKSNVSRRWPSTALPAAQCWGHCGFPGKSVHLIYLSRVHFCGWYSHTLSTSWPGRIFCTPRFV